MQPLPISSKTRPDWPSALELCGDARKQLPRLVGDLDFLRELVWNDASTEYDARHLSAFFSGNDIDFSAAFWAAHAKWACEEERHYQGMLAVLEGLAGECNAATSRTWREELRARPPDLSALEQELGSEFEVLLAAAYDELVTVRAYRANLLAYDRLGPAMRRFIRLVIADEAAHYASFLELLLTKHKGRLQEAPAELARIRGKLDAAPYGNSFLFDHHGVEYTSALKDRAASILLGQLRRGSASGTQRDPGATYS